MHRGSRVNDLQPPRKGEVSSVQAPPRLTQQLLKLERLVRDVSTGQMTIEAYASSIDDLAAAFSARLEAVRRIEIPTDFATEIAEEMRAGTRGIELYLEAANLLRSYVFSRDLGALTAGLEQARVANDLVNEAMRLNWQTYETYRLAAEEFLAQRGS